MQQLTPVLNIMFKFSELSLINFPCQMETLVKRNETLFSQRCNRCTTCVRFHVLLTSTGTVKGPLDFKAVSWKIIHFCSCVLAANIVGQISGIATYPKQTPLDKRSFNFLGEGVTFISQECELPICFIVCLFTDSRCRGERFVSKVTSQFQSYYRSREGFHLGFNAPRICLKLKMNTVNAEQYSVLRSK